MVLCSFTRDSKKGKDVEKKKIQFMDNVKLPSEAGMMCSIDSNTFHSFMKNTWIGDSGASCHITNDESGMYDIINIDELIQGSSSIMLATFGLFKPYHLLCKIWKMGKKIPETPFGTSSTETLHTLASLFPIGLLFIHGINITIIDICNKQDSLRSASRFIQNH